MHTTLPSDKSCREVPLNFMLLPPQRVVYTAYPTQQLELRESNACVATFESNREGYATSVNSG